VPPLDRSVRWPLDYADDVALFAEMLDVLLLDLDITNQEARPFGIDINWDKNKNSDKCKFICSRSPASQCCRQLSSIGYKSSLILQANLIDLVEVNQKLRRSAIDCECMKFSIVTCGATAYHFTYENKRVFSLHSSSSSQWIWTVISGQSWPDKKVDVFHMWCQRGGCFASPLHITSSTRLYECTW